MNISNYQNKTKRFREILLSKELCFLMEAHDALSALIVEKAGFPGIWASSLSISSVLGLRDANEASWSQILEIVEHMADATSIPILVDGDSGYGNFNNVRRFVRKLCQRGVSGVCFEDKLFPKLNSFCGEKQLLADTNEFCSRIKAGKDSQTDDNFSIIARTEAFIAGHGLDEALNRAEAYHNAGADAILIHSKLNQATEILAFTKEWENRCPVLIVPTKYYTTPTSVFREAGISMVIWGNHNLRASITAMNIICQRVNKEESIANIESEITSLNELFKLLNYDELFDAEKRYFINYSSQPSKLIEITKTRESNLVSV